jgi:hypothetical protein
MDPILLFIIGFLGLLVFCLIVQITTFVVYHTVMVLRDRDQRKGR